MSKVSGIYKIVNMANGKCYVGSAVNIMRRWAEHKTALNNQKHHSRHLQGAWNTYKSDSFGFVILEEVPKESLIQREQYWIDLLNAYGKGGYNVTPKANSSLGIKRSHETRARIAMSKLGQVPWNKGIKTGPQSPELVERRVGSKRGTSRPDDVIEKISKTKREAGHKPTPAVLAQSAFVRQRNAELRRLGQLPPLFDAERKKQVGAAISAAKRAASAARKAENLLTAQGT